MARIIVQFSGKIIDTHDLSKPEMIIGREPTCDIAIDNLAISRQHCKIVQSEGVYSIMDLGSNNGTFINGRKIKVHNLNDRDEIILGKFLLVFEDEHARAKVPSSSAIPALADGPHTMAVDVNKMEQVIRDRASLKRARLVAKNPDGREITIPLAKPILIIGKLPSSDWKIQGFMTAKHQALIHVDAQGYRLVNLGNWTKTRVNDQSVEEAILRSHDVIKIGPNTATFFEEE